MEMGMMKRARSKDIMNKISGICALTAVLGASPVAAQYLPSDGPSLQPWYMGVGFGKAHWDRSGSDLTGLMNTQLDDSSSEYLVRAGWRFSPFMALEVGYYNFGRYDFSGTASGAAKVDDSLKIDTVGLSFVGILPIDYFDLYGRIGVGRSRVSIKTPRISTNEPLAEPITVNNESSRQNEAIYGVGARWAFAPHWALFAEWMKNNRVRTDGYVGGIDFRF
jgi:opacity protein-like surface antigen